MKTTSFNLAIVSICAGILGAAPLAYAAGVTTWSGAGANQNWSTAGNWTTVGGSTPPAAGDSVVFRATGDVGTAGTINNVVDAGFTAAIGGLWLTNDVANIFHTTQIPAGNTLTVNGPISIGTNNQTATYTFTGGGTLKGGSGASVFQVATFNGGTLTCDMTPLTNFVFNAGGAGANFVIGVDTGASSGGVLKLASVSNSITATTMIVGNNNTSGTSTLNLGSGTNNINASTLNVSFDKSIGTVQFNSVSGGLRLRNAAGTGRSTVSVCGNGHSGSSGSTTIGNISLKGHYVDMQIGTLSLANRAARSGGSDNAFFSFDTGIVDCTAVTMAINTSGGTAPVGSLAVGGGTLKVGTAVSLVNCAGTGGTGSLIITNGATAIVSNIVKTTSTGTGIITVNSATLTLSSLNSTIGSPSIPVDSLSLSNATLHLTINAAATDPKIVATTVNTNGVNTIVLDSVVGAAGTVTLPLISYTGNDPFSSLTLNATALPAGYSANLDDSVSGTVQLIINAPVSSALVWTGTTNSLLVSIWDTNKTKDWVDAATLTIPQVYGDPDTVLFDDTASTNVVTLVNQVLPLGVTFNNSAKNYVLNGTGKISGLTGLTLENNGTVTLAETGGDNFSGAISAGGGGTLIFDNANSAISGALTIAGGSTAQIGNNDANGVLPTGGLDDEGALIIKRSNAYTISSAISGGGALTQNGNGTLTLSASNSYTGGTFVTKGTLALTGAGSITTSPGLLVSNATFDVSAIVSQTTVLGDFSVSNAVINVNPTNLVTPISVATLEADGNTANSNIINVLALPGIASYPATITLIKSASPITLANGTFNFAVGTLPAASPAYAGSLTESANSLSIQLTLTAGPVGTRASDTWAGVVNVNATTNWSDQLNWQLPGVPAATDNAFFDGTTTVNNNTTINNVVDMSFTNASLTYNQTVSGQWHNTLIPAGNVLTITGALGVGTGTPGGSTTSVTISGLGELDADGALNLNGVGGTSDTHQTLDMSGLSTFKNLAPTATMSLGTAAQQAVTLSLASNSVINVGTLNVEATAGNNGRTGNLNLGAITNTVYAVTINVSTGKGGVTKVQFGANAPAGTVAIAGTGGSPARATIVLGNATSGSAVCNGELLLAGHLANVLAGSLTMGGVNGSTGSANTGIVTFDDGTFDVTSIFMGSSVTAHSSTGTFTVGGDATHSATLTVGAAGGGSLVLGNATISAGTGAGALNVNVNGVANINCSITKSATAGAINTATVSLTDGVLNMLSGTIGTPTTPIDTLNLSDSGALDTKIQVNAVAGVPSIAATTVNIVGGVTTLNINAITGVIGTAQIPIISYTGSSPFSGLVLGTVPAGYTGGSLVDSGTSIDLIITSPAPIVWNGVVGSTLNGSWDTSTFNWLNGAAPTAYADADFVQFDDTGKTNVVTLATTVSPAGLDVSNNLVNYTFNGGSKISGPTALIKQGTGNLLVDNGGINDFSGGVNIGGGTVQFGNNDANGNIPASGNITDNGTLAIGRTDSITVANLITGSGGVAQNGSGTSKLTAANSYGGATLISSGTIIAANAGANTGNSALGVIPGGAVTITNGGTLDLSGITTANAIGFTNSSGQAKQFYIAGAGVGGNGAIVNNGTVNQQDAFQLITLTANATVGGPARWDMRGNPLIIPVLDLGGFTLTKSGSNQMSMVNLIVTNGGSIVINQGILSFETTSSNSTAPITVNAGGVLGHFRENAGLFTAPITLNGGMIRDLNGTPGSTNDSPITLTANSFLDLNVGSTDLLQLNGVISESAGSFGLTKTNIGSFALSATNTYSGTTLVQQGRLLLVGNGSITNSRSLIVATNGTLDASQRGDSTLTLYANQTLSGFGTVTGAVAAVNGSTIAPGSPSNTGVLTLANNVTLGGTNTMKVSRLSVATNDVLAVGGTLTLGGTLNVTSLGGTYAANDTFTLFNAAGGISGTFTATNLPALGGGLGWVTSNLANGILSVVATVNTTPTNITATVSGNVLTLSWPADHTGWRLLAQTNSIATGLNPNTNAWVAIPGTASVNTTNMTINPANGTVFYRLVYP